MRSALLGIGLMLALAVPNWAIWQKELLLDRGHVVLLELAPVDPRSLIEGDYMRIEYAVARAIQRSESWSDDGAIVVALDEDSVAAFVRPHNPARPLAPGERLLKYRKRGQRLRLATDAYFFQEGTAPKYERARYGELRVDDDGSSILVGLRDSLRVPIR